jgi:hypothetical protein
MARFNAAKVWGAIDKKFQDAFNYLIDLLDAGYRTEATIGGKLVVVEINPRTGLSITVDGTKVAGIDSAGNFFSSRIASPSSPATSFAIIGDLDGGGGTSISLFDTEQQEDFIFQVSETVDGSDILTGFAISDANDVTRIAVSNSGEMHLSDDNSVARISVFPSGDIIMYDGSGNIRSWFNEVSNFCMMRAVNGASYNEVGVDATGAYKITAGSKTYL